MFVVVLLCIKCTIDMYKYFHLKVTQEVNLKKIKNTNNKRFDIIKL